MKGCVSCCSKKEAEVVMVMGGGGTRSKWELKEGEYTGEGD